MAALRAFSHEGLTFDVDDSGGEGAPVVLLHGYPANKRCWDGVTPRLTAGGYRVLAPDQRGYSPGARPPGRRSYAIHHLVGDVLALADAAGAERFHLVGHDWGGMVAWAVAARHAHRLGTVTSLAAPHPRAIARSVLSSAQALRSWYVLFSQLPWVPEASVQSGPGGTAFVRTLVRSGLSASRATEYLACMRSGAAGPAINWYRAIPFAPPLTAASTVAVPTLHVHGTADVALGRRAADLTGRYVRAPYRYEVLEGTSHWLPEEAAEVVAALVLAHLGAHPL